MKKITQKLFAVLLALAVMTTGFANSVHAFSDSNEARVTVSGLKEGDKVNFYKVVQAEYENGDFKAFNLINGLVDPEEEITLTFTDGDKNYTITKQAKDLDLDGDGMVDASPVKLASVTATAEGETNPDTLENKEWAFTSHAKDVIYNMNAPTQQQINKVVAEGKLPSSATKTVTVKPGETWAYADLPAGQYIGVVTPAAGNDTSYNPVVVSVGVKGLPVYKAPEEGQAATHYKKINGEYVTDAPTDKNYFEYDNCEWDAENNKAIFADSKAEYAKKYVPDGQTEENRLVAKNLDVSKKYDWTLDGTEAVFKSQNPNVDKSAKTDKEEKNKLVALVASDLNGDELLKDEKLVYILPGYTQENINDALKDKKFKLEGNVYVQDDSGDVTGAAALDKMTTDDAKLAQTVNKADKIWNGGQGDTVHYTVTATIPQYPLNAKNKTLSFTDKMSEGLDYVEGSLDISFESGKKVHRIYDADNKLYDFYVVNAKHNIANADASVDKYAFINNAFVKVDATNVGSLAADQDLYVLLAKAKEGTATDDFQVNFIYDSLPGKEGQKEAPILKYDSIIKDTAIKGIEGNDNVVRMYYANSTGQGKTWETDDYRRPNGEGITERHDSEKVYTYEIKFRKTNDEEEFIEKPQDSTDTNTYYLLKDEPKEEQYNDQDVFKAAHDLWLSLRSQSTGWYDVKGDFKGYLVPKTTVGTDTAKLALVHHENNVEYVENPKFETLPGAVFGLYDNTGKLICEITTGPDGIGHTTLVSAGTYKLKEITPPTGYAKTNQEITVEANWTSATTRSMDEVTRYVYTVDITEAMDMNGDGNKPAVKTDGTVDVSNAPADVLAEDQVGWLVGTGEKVPFYENDYFDIANDWTYDEVNHTMTNKKDGVVIKNVFRAYMKSTTTTKTINENTEYNNNGGTVALVRYNNSKTPELPSTGGIGTYIFTIAGVAILASAAFMLIFRKKEHA